MALDESAVTETELNEDTPVMLVDGKPVPPSAIQLVDGVFIDEAGRPAAMVKHQTCISFGPGARRIRCPGIYSVDGHQAAAPRRYGSGYL